MQKLQNEKGSKKDLDRGKPLLHCMVHDINHCEDIEHINDS